jgi:phosphatidylserine/phosphatidylglycerophosphate/cardiolipin synthase-like enzyme
MLFNLAEEFSEQTESNSAGMNVLLNYKLPADNKIESVLNLVESNACIQWVSHAEWSAIDLLIGLLIHTGPANVYLSSYAFSEHPARTLADLKNRQLINELYCLIDSRIDKRSASALTLIRNCATGCKLMNTHAKVTIVENEKTEVVIIGSANYTDNNRYEAGVIIVNPVVVKFHKKWMQHELTRTDR